MVEVGRQVNDQLPRPPQSGHPPVTRDGASHVSSLDYKQKDKDGKRPVTVAVVGAGQRGKAYADYALKHPDQAKVVAVAEPRVVRRKAMVQAHSVDPSMVFTDWTALAAKGRIADAVWICVMDEMHAELVAEFAKQGYHILCEKPMATSISDCVQMVKDVEANGQVFGVGHVLRYGMYNAAIKEVIDSGALGEIVNIQHIEPVGDLHFCHSFVRGNWSKEEETTFALLAKCCHDLDILSFYLSGRTPKRVSSFGSLFHFKPSQKPKEAGDAKTCLECDFERKCPWSAKRMYVDPFLTEDPVKKLDRRWAEIAVVAESHTAESVTEGLKNNPYGKCVYEAGNDVVDHQIVNIEYEGGVTASMTMSAFTEAMCARSTRIHGTKGELEGDMETFTVFDFLTRKKTLHAPPMEGGHHGGADIGFARTFIEAVAKEDQAVLKTTAQDILNSHLIVFAAEQARLESSVVDFDTFKKQAVSGEIVHSKRARVG